MFSSYRKLAVAVLVGIAGCGSQAETTPEAPTVAGTPVKVDGVSGLPDSLDVETLMGKKAGGCMLQAGESAGSLELRCLADPHAGTISGGSFDSDTGSCTDDAICAASNGHVRIEVRGTSRTEAQERLAAVVSTLGSVRSAPAPAPRGGTWTFVYRQEGGYVFRVTVAVQPPRHATEAGVGACRFNGAADAEYPAKVTLTNATPNFAAMPEMSLWFGTSSDGFAVADSAGCEDDNTNGAYLRATSPLAGGQSITENVSLLVPGYYSPDSPDGDPSVAGLHQLQVSIYGDESGGNHGTYSASGPDGTLPDDANVDLTRISS